METTICPRCEGEGRIWLGFRTCPTCFGEGRIPVPKPITQGDIDQLGCKARDEVLSDLGFLREPPVDHFRLDLPLRDEVHEADLDPSRGLDARHELRDVSRTSSRWNPSEDNYTGRRNK